ncbi:SusC/RagA family TonB-linked outer membrane protein [Flavivirga amylovorans]|uniref:SusC/RagA family TonB-linked outer membrane protein n=1 Tax=Flavivirga amylovorans TaxID=870486 RepID=A0ABT8X0Z3_9FLAO|nr:SusC/RagA family TonB-linked outer membrane protein [Flavivirga amylovorans]MDO5987619.1 SusC/RagA family TonB-linked outer membrane protein [Flavivirga amylovorans]
MRTFILLFCSTVFSLTSDGVFSQNAKIKIDADRTISVDEVFKIIKTQTDFNFIYKSGMFKDYPKINVKKGVINANRLLEKSLSKGDFKFNISANNTITIRQASEVQELVITGTVTDENNLPLSRITVYVSNREPTSEKISSDFVVRSTSTDFDGKFTIKADVGHYLIVSGLGYEFFKDQIKAEQTVYNITLKESISELNEVVVVSSGYQKISKERATGSYSVIKGKDVKTLETSVQARLEGLVPGVLNSTFGDANFMVNFLPDSDNDNRLIMRGISTITGNSSPLVVIDGFPTDEGLSSINPNNIEKITFLRDGAAASIWGAQSSNGVIVITTKKGSASVPKVSYRYTHQLTPKWDLDYLNKANASETIDYLEEVLGDALNGIGPNTIETSRPTELSYLMRDLRNGAIDQITYDAAVAEIRARGDNFDQSKDKLLAFGTIQQHDLAVQGGGDKINYRASLNYLSKEGGYVGNENEKINFRLNNEFKISDRLTASLGLNFIYEDADYSPIFAREPGVGGRSAVIDQIAPWEQLVDDQGNYLNQSRNYIGEPLGLRGFFNLRHSDFVLDRYGIETHSNLLNDIDETSRGFKSFLTRLQTNINYKITKDLTFNAGFQYERGSRTDKSFWSKNARILNQSRAAFTRTDFVTGDIVEEIIPEGALQQVNTGDNYAYTIRGTLNYDKTFGKHSIVLLGGGEINKRFNEFYKSTQFGFDPSTLIEKPVDINDLNGVIFPSLNANRFTFYFDDFENFREITSQDDRFASYFGNMGYIFDKKYILNASARVDNFNLYGGNARFNQQPLWSLGAGWNISKENFMESISWINNLKLAYTYGSNGNVVRGAIPELQISQNFDAFAGQIIGTIESPKNDALKWEETVTNNIKLDFGLFDYKLSGSLDFYHRKSIDVLSSREIDPTYGIRRVTANNGTIVNKGFELELNTKLIQRENFYWGATMLVSYNKNEVLDVETSERKEVPENLLRGLYSAPGLPANGLYSLQWAGISEEGLPQVLDVNGEATTQYTDLTGIDMLVFSGSVVPNWVGSFRSQFRYKNLELSTMFVGSFGHVMRRDVPNLNFNQITRPHADVVNRWKQSGDEATSNVPRIGTRFTEPILSNNLYQFADINVISADYIKLREVSLIYNIPESVLSSLSIGPSQLILQVNNPWRWTANNDGIDPEAHELSYGTRLLPIMTSYTVGLNINF